MPEKPEIELQGTLVYSLEEGIELNLLGEFDDLHLSDKPHDINLICGFTTKGKEISLYKCFESHRSSSMPGIATSKYIVNYLFVGKYFKTRTELVFNNLTAEIDKLSPWVRKYGFKKTEYDKALQKTTVVYERPQEIKFKIADGIIGQFNFSFTAPFTKNIPKINLEQKSHLELRLDHLKHFDKIIKDYFHFQNFLTVGLYHLTHPISIKLRDESFQQADASNKEKIDIRLFFRPHILQNQTKKNHARDFLFSYEDVETDFEKFIQHWFENENLLKPVISMIVDSFNHNSPFTENSFLNIVQGLETYHRRFENNANIPKEKHKQRVTEILDTVHEKHKKWLESKLHFSNEPTLHQRLEFLLEENRNETLDKIIADKSKFIKDVKNSRNYYTHYDKRLEKKSIKGTELYLLSEKLKILLICVILKKIGIPKEKISELLSRNEWRFFNHLFD